MNQRRQFIIMFDHTKMNVFRVVPILFLVISIIGGQRIAEQKCAQYSSLFPRDLKRHSKGIIDSFLSNFLNFPAPGKIAAEPGEFPHMAHLGYGDGDEKVFICAGTLISDEYVLTTATCTTVDVVFLHENKKRETATEKGLLSILGIEDEDDDDDEDDTDEQENFIDRLPPLESPVKWIKLGNNYTGLEEFMVKQIFVHPDHDDSPLHSNIALLKLNRKVSFSANIRPACLYDRNTDLINITLMASGWGTTAFDKLLSKHLMKVPLVALSEDECSLPIDWTEHGLLDDTHICVGDREEKNTLCQGDGGDPLQMINDKYPNMYDVVAITSFGYTCNVMLIPVYGTRVSSYVPWIENIVWPI